MFPTSPENCRRAILACNESVKNSLDRMRSVSSILCEAASCDRSSVELQQVWPYFKEMSVGVTYLEKVIQTLSKITPKLVTSVPSRW